MITVVDHDPAWAERFVALAARLRPALDGIACTVEHVGSTSVPGLAAKPVIDVNILLADPADLRAAIEALQGLGYSHLGDLGIPDRHAFRHPHTTFAHNLYCTPASALAARNHLAFRDALRADPALCAEYGALKKRLATSTDDIDVYVERKTALIVRVLRDAGLGADALADITDVNRA